MMSNKKSPPTVVLKSRDYQPKKAEIQEEFTVDVPGETVVERMDNFGKIVTRPVKLRYRNA